MFSELNSSKEGLTCPFYPCHPGLSLTCPPPPWLPVGKTATQRGAAAGRKCVQRELVVELVVSSINMIVDRQE
jgi:hypothetical protein